MPFVLDRPSLPVGSSQGLGSQGHWSGSGAAGAAGMGLGRRRVPARQLSVIWDQENQLGAGYGRLILREELNAGNCGPRK